VTEQLVMLPNVEALVSAFLRDQAEVTALVDDRVYTALPKGVEFPAVRVVQYDDVKHTRRPLWVVHALLQIDCWGGSKHDAWQTAATVQGVLAARLAGVHDLGVVTGVDVGGLADTPDQDFEPAKPRWTFTATVFAHPNP
jgi:hypothetical protein